MGQPTRSTLFFVVSACLVVSVLLLAGPPPARGELPAEIKAVISAPQYKGSYWGLLVEDLVSGEVLYELNADKLFIPASTTKLFTVAAALEALGADFRFETPIYRRGTLTPSGELRGDLILVASGDLTLGGRTTPEGEIAFTEFDHTDAAVGGAVLTKTDPLAGLNRLAQQVAASGVKRVRGEVLIDDRLFETSRPETGAEFIRTPIIVNDNLIDFIITPTQPGQAAEIEWRPHTAAYQIDARVETVAAGQEPRFEIGQAGPGRVIVRGQAPAGHKPLIRVFQVPDPASFARSLLIEALDRAGVAVDASPLSDNPSDQLPRPEDYAGLSRAAQLVSPPFAETARLILKISHNLGAETLPLLIAVKHGQRTFEEGMLLEAGYLERLGVDIQRISLSDGEGGAHGDRVTPRVALQLLRRMAGRPGFKAYRRALPCLGVDGSLAHAVPPDSPARGKAQAKTGTSVTGDLLNNRPFLAAKALAGYMTTASGRRLAFALYVNNLGIAKISDAWQVGNDLGRICEIIYKAD